MGGLGAGDGRCGAHQPGAPHHGYFVGGGVPRLSVGAVPLELVSAPLPVAASGGVVPAPASPGIAPMGAVPVVAVPSVAVESVEVPSAAVEPLSGVDMSVGDATAPSSAGTVSVSLWVVPSFGELQAASIRTAGKIAR
jgi:hypothetical protein